MTTTNHGSPLPNVTPRTALAPTPPESPAVCAKCGRDVDHFVHGDAPSDVARAQAILVLNHEFVESLPAKVRILSPSVSVAPDERLRKVAEDQTARINLVGRLSALRDLWRTVGNRNEAFAQRDAAKAEAERIEADIRGDNAALLSRVAAAEGSYASYGVMQRERAALRASQAETLQRLADATNGWDEQQSTIEALRASLSSETARLLPHLTDAQVSTICRRLSPTYDVPVGAMKWALGDVSTTSDLPDGTWTYTAARRPEKTTP